MHINNIICQRFNYDDPYLDSNYRYNTIFEEFSINNNNILIYSSIKLIQKNYRIYLFNKKLPILWKISEYYSAKKYHPNGKFMKNYIKNLD